LVKIRRRGLFGDVAAANTTYYNVYCGFRENFPSFLSSQLFLHLQTF